MADRHTVQDYVRRYEMQMAPSSDADNPVQKGECASARAERRRERNAVQLSPRVPQDWYMPPQNLASRHAVMNEMLGGRTPRMKVVGNGAAEARGIMITSQRDPAHGFALTLATLADGVPREAPNAPTPAVLSSQLSPRNRIPSQWIGGSLAPNAVEFVGGDLAYNHVHQMAPAATPSIPMRVGDTSGFGSPRAVEASGPESWLSPRYHNLFAPRPAAQVASDNAKVARAMAAQAHAHASMSAAVHSRLSALELTPRPDYRTIVTDQMRAEAAAHAAGVAAPAWHGAMAGDVPSRLVPVSLSPRSVIPPGIDMDKPRLPVAYPGVGGVPRNHHNQFKHDTWAIQVAIPPWPPRTPSEEDRPRP